MKNPRADDEGVVHLTPGEILDEIELLDATSAQVLANIRRLLA